MTGRGRIRRPSDAHRPRAAGREPRELGSIIAIARRAAARRASPAEGSPRQAPDHASRNRELIGTDVRLSCALVIRSGQEQIRTPTIRVRASPPDPRPTKPRVHTSPAIAGSAEVVDIGLDLDDQHQPGSGIEGQDVDPPSRSVTPDFDLGDHEPTGGAETHAICGQVPSVGRVALVEAVAKERRVDIPAESSTQDPEQALDGVERKVRDARVLDRPDPRLRDSASVAGVAGSRPSAKRTTCRCEPTISTAASSIGRVIRRERLSGGQRTQRRALGRIARGRPRPSSATEVLSALRRARESTEPTDGHARWAAYGPLTPVNGRQDADQGRAGWCVLPPSSPKMLPELVTL